MHIESPTVESADAVTDMWVALASEQREYGSHLLADENRNSVRELVASHIVAGGLLVAREGEGEGKGESEGEDLLGFVLFDRESGNYEQDTDRGIVRYIYVRPAHRSQGIGTELLEAAESRMFDGGVDAVALDVLADNDEARRFYRRHGYEPHRVEMETESDTHSKDG